MSRINKLLALFACAIIIWPVDTFAKTQVVRMESQTSVANTTTGGGYQKSINAQTDDVVAVQIWYHNKGSGRSGKTAKDLRAKISLPASGSQTITSTVSSDNSKTITDTANINLSTGSASLEYIPGSAQWRHNMGTNQNPNFVTQNISDAIVTSEGTSLGNAKPHFNSESTVSILARVKEPTVSIVKQVKVDDGQSRFAAENSARPQDTLSYVLIIKNEGNTVLRQVRVADGLPPNLTFVPGSTKLVSSNTGSGGSPMADGLATGGITIDDMSPGSTQYVYFKATVGVWDCQQSGNHRLRNSASVVAEGTNQIFNVAHTNVMVPACAQAPPPPAPVTPVAAVSPPVQQVEVKPLTIPETGPELALAAGVGGSAIGYFLHAYRRSRQSLMERMLSRRR